MKPLLVKKSQKITIPSNHWLVDDNHKIYFERDFQRYSQKAADFVIDALRETLRTKKMAVFVPSSGKSPTMVYEILRKQYSGAIDWGRVVVMQMDEYWGLPDSDRQSMSNYIERNIVKPLGIRKYIHFFDNRGTLIQTLGTYERLIERLGGIDLVLHGIGRNGHIGFNEPYSKWSSSTRKVKLADTTLSANFGSNDSFTKVKYQSGVTIGLRMLTKAKLALLLISGSAKITIVKKFLSEKQSPAIPASSLCLNAEVRCIIDGDSIPYARIDTG